MAVFGIAVIFTSIFHYHPSSMIFVNIGLAQSCGLSRRTISFVCIAQTCLPPSFQNILLLSQHQLLANSQSEREWPFNSFIKGIANDDKEIPVAENEFNCQGWPCQK